MALGLWGILPAGFSGITHIADQTYAVVDDGASIDGFQFLTLDIDSVTGELRDARLTEPSDMSLRRQRGETRFRDCEGITYCASTGTVFVSGEEDQRILEYTLTGKPTGRELAVPSIMQKGMTAPNLGFEALTYNDHQHLFWTTTEATLPADGEHATLSHPDVVNRLRLVAFDTTLCPVASYTYAMDVPRKPTSGSTFVYGVPSMLALDDGSLLVMEREACIPRRKLGSYVTIRLYQIHPQQATTPSQPLDWNGRLPQEEPKTLVGTFTTHLRLGRLDLANYEGMCLGPKLKDGRQTIILIADSQHGAGNKLYHLKDYIRIAIMD